MTNRRPKKLLVLGASLYQMPAIQTAARLGYEVLTTDNSPANPGHRLAHASFRVDTTDTEGVLALAHRERIAGILAPATDVAVPTAAHVASRLGLNGPPLPAAGILTRKAAFRGFAALAGLSYPRWFPVAAGALPPAGILDGRPWLVKPNVSSGSKGVAMVRTVGEFRERVEASCAISLDGAAVLEEFLEGTQHTCEGVLCDGRIALALVTDRDTAPPPHTATAGHRVPTRLNGTMQVAALAAIEEIFRWLGIRGGPFDCDFVAADGRVTLLELTPRVGGNSLCKLFHAALGFDLVAYAVSHACGDPYPIPAWSQPKPMSIAILGVRGSGRLAWSLAEAESLRLEKWVGHLDFDLPRGAPVAPFTNGRNRVGEVLLAGADRDDLDRRLIEFERRLALTAV